MDRVLTALRAAGEPTRLRLLVLCAQTELTVSELTQILGQSQPRVSRHLKMLCDAGLLTRSREGTWAYFRLARSGFAGQLNHLILSMEDPGDTPELALDLERLEAIKEARTEAAARYFRENAARWDEMRSLHVPEQEVEQALLDALPAEGIGDLLDVGTGTGRMLELFAARVRRAVGLDSSREMLGIARTKLTQAGLHNCEIRHGDMYQMPLPSASFDAAIIHQVLHYAEDPEGVLAETARILRPGGRLVVVDFAPHDLESLRVEHKHRRLGFSDAEIVGWCRLASLACTPHRRLPGDPLTVTLWTATRLPTAQVEATVPVYSHTGVVQ